MCEEYCERLGLIGTWRLVWGSSFWLGECRARIFCRNRPVRKKGGAKRVREPRYAIKTRTDTDVMDDGYKWRKYGQKAVKNSPHPRYKICICTSSSTPELNSLGSSSKCRYHNEEKIEAVAPFKRFVHYVFISSVERPRILATLTLGFVVDDDNHQYTHNAHRSSCVISNMDSGYTVEKSIRYKFRKWYH